MSIRAKGSEFHPLTLELATEISTMPAFPGERPRKQSRIQYFRNHLEQGTFVSPSWAVVELAGTAERYRADGQHTSTMLAGVAPEAFPKGLFVNIRVFEVDDVKMDGPEVFDLFDNPHSVRSNTDKIAFYCAEFPELRPLGEGFLYHVAAGIDSWLKDNKIEDAPRHTPREYGVYFLDNADNREFAKWLHQWKDSLHNFMISKTGVVSEIRADYAANVEFATEFWGQAFTETHPDPEDETRLLTRQLKEWIGQPKKKQSDFQRVARKYWNRWVKPRRYEQKQQDSGVAEAVLVNELPPTVAPVQPSL
jgi:hypothetical protein